MDSGWVGAVGIIGADRCCAKAMACAETNITVIKWTGDFMAAASPGSHSQREADPAWSDERNECHHRPPICVAMPVGDEASRARADQCAGKHVGCPMDVVVHAGSGYSAGQTVGERRDQPAVRVGSNDGGQSEGIGGMSGGE